MTQPPSSPYDPQPSSPYQPGPPPGYSPYPPAQQPRTSRAMGGWALGLSVVGCIPLALLAGAGLGIAVLVKSRDGRDRGRGLAIAALAVAGLWLAAWVTVVAVALAGGFDTGPERGEDGSILESGQVALQDLRVGDCFDEQTPVDPDGGEVAGGVVDAVPCEDSHSFEVYHVYELASGDYPGFGPTRELAAVNCRAEVEAFLGGPTAEQPLQPVFYFPDEEAFEGGDTSVQCALTDPSGPTAGSLRNSVE